MKDAEKLSATEQKQLAAIIQLIEDASKLQDIIGIKKLQGHKSAYRIRMGKNRIGLFFEQGVVELVRILTRKDIYRYFP